MTEDLLILDDVIADHKFIIKSCNIFTKHLENDLPYHDSLAIYFDGWASPNVLEFNNSTFQNLIAIGPEYISNTNLRNTILKLYNYYYAKVRTFNDYY